MSHMGNSHKMGKRLGFRRLGTRMPIFLRSTFGAVGDHNGMRRPSGR